MRRVITVLSFFVIIAVCGLVLAGYPELRQSHKTAHTATGRVNTVIRRAVALAKPASTREHSSRCFTCGRKHWHACWRLRYNRQDHGWRKHLGDSVERYKANVMGRFLYRCNQRNGCRRKWDDPTNHRWWR